MRCAGTPRAPAHAVHPRIRHRAHGTATQNHHEPAVSSSVDALRRKYAENGWFTVPAVLSDAEVRELHNAVDTCEREAAHLTESASFRGVYFEVQSASGRKREVAVAPGCLRKITGPSKRHPAFASLRTHPRILELAESVCDVSRPVAVVDQANCKAAELGTGFPWHQDSSFLFGDARRNLARFGGVNCVIALDASDAENGGFEVLGGTHMGGFVDLHGIYDTAVDNDAHTDRYDVSKRTLPPLLPGDVIFFHPQLAHGSGANRSRRRRRLATLWFVGSAPPLAAGHGARL